MPDYFVEHKDGTVGMYWAEETSFSDLFEEDDVMGYVDGKPIYRSKS